MKIAISLEKEENSTKQSSKTYGMERLFTTDLTINGRKTTYNVVFENEQYVFYPQQQGQEQPFAFKREEDEWHPQSRLEEAVQQAAVASLESYLLSQH